MTQVKSLDCPNCGASISDTSKHCGHCGSRVVLSDDRQKFVLAGIICKNCGTDNKDKNRFCSNCGDKLFKICPLCNKDCGLDDQHCPSCGANFASPEKKREIIEQKVKEILDELRNTERDLFTFRQYNEKCHIIRTGKQRELISEFKLLATQYDLKNAVEKYIVALTNQYQFSMEQKKLLNDIFIIPDKLNIDNSIDFLQLINQTIVRAEEAFKENQLRDAEKSKKKRFGFFR